MKENFKLIKYKQRLCKLKKIKDQIGFIENYSYQLKFLYKKIRAFKTSQSKLFINVSSSSIFHKIIKKFSLHNKYLMQAVN